MASKWGAATQFLKKINSSSKYAFQMEETPFRIQVFNVVLDIVISQLDLRFQGMKDIVTLFEIASL